MMRTISGAVLAGALAGGANALQLREADELSGALSNLANSINDTNLDEWVTKGVATALFPQDGETQCWRTTYTLGARAISYCPPHKERSLALCYDKCRDGYTGALNLCTQSGGCPSGFSNLGPTCVKPAPKWRGGGWWWWNVWKCRRDHSQGCEWSIWAYFPRCTGPWTGRANLCFAQCQWGHFDLGLVCKKKTHWRDLGHALWCKPSEQQIGALCYDYCASGYTRVALTCWKDQCPKHMKECGAQCILDRMSCTAQITALTFGTIIDIAAMVASGGATVAAKETAKQLAKQVVKIGAKAAVKQAFRIFIKEVVKLFSKEGAKKVLKELAKKMVKEIVKSGIQHQVDKALETGIQNPVDWAIETVIKEAVGSAANIMDYMDSCSLLQWGKCADLMQPAPVPWLQGQVQKALDEFKKTGTMEQLKKDIQAAW